MAIGPAEVREAFRKRMDAICGRLARPGSLYFAYGSNLLDREIKVSAASAQPEGIAYLPGWRLMFNKHSKSRGDKDTADIQKCASRVVWGFVYRVTDEDKDGLKRCERGYREQTLKALMVEMPVTARTVGRSMSSRSLARRAASITAVRRTRTSTLSSRALTRVDFLTSTSQTLKLPLPTDETLGPARTGQHQAQGVPVLVP